MGFFSDVGRRIWDEVNKPQREREAQQQALFNQMKWQEYAERVVLPAMVRAGLLSKECFIDDLLLTHDYPCAGYGFQLPRVIDESDAMLLRRLLREHLVRFYGGVSVKQLREKVVIHREFIEIIVPV